MSDTQNIGSYSMSAQTQTTAGAVFLSVSTPISDSITDEDFLAIAAGIEAAFPASWGVTIASGGLQVVKQITNVNTWSPDMTQNPPVFS